MTLFQQGMKNNLSCFKQLETWTKYMKQQLLELEHQEPKNSDPWAEDRHSKPCKRLSLLSR